MMRLAVFEGSQKPGQAEAFRQTATDRPLAPRWTFSCANDVRVMVRDPRDEGVLELPLIPAIGGGDLVAKEAALEGPARFQPRHVTGEIAAQFFACRIHHHVTKVQALVG